MASSRTRQRRLARAKVDRQLARRAERTRRGRQIKAVVAIVLSVAVVALGTTWLLGGFDSKPDTVEASDCFWNPLDIEDANLKQVGTPPTTGVDQLTQSDMTVAFDTGTVVASLDHELAPCATMSLKFLADQGFYNDTNCHELTHADGNFGLSCGDPSGTGAGGAAYTFAGENMVSEPAEGTTATYPAGTVAMHTNTSGSRFVIFYEDSNVPNISYSVVGKITSGLDVIKDIAKTGTIENEAGEDVTPKNEVTIKTVTVAAAEVASPPADATPSPTAS